MSFTWTRQALNQCLLAPRLAGSPPGPPTRNCINEWLLTRLIWKSVSTNYCRCVVPANDFASAVARPGGQVSRWLCTSWQSLFHHLGHHLRIDHVNGHDHTNFREKSDTSLISATHVRELIVGYESISVSRQLQSLLSTENYSWNFHRQLGVLEFHVSISNLTWSVLSHWQSSWTILEADSAGWYISGVLEILSGWFCNITTQLVVYCTRVVWVS